MARPHPERIHAADVVRVARDFVDELGPEDLASLPEGCRPNSMKDPADVTAYALDIVRYHCEGNAHNGALTARLAQLFSDASMRISQLALTANSEGASRQSA